MGKGSHEKNNYLQILISLLLEDFPDMFPVNVMQRCSGFLSGKGRISACVASGAPRTSSAIMFGWLAFIET